MNNGSKIQQSKGFGSHTVKLEDRKKIELGAIEDVISFDEGSVVLGSSLGVISIEGEGLHILKMNVDSGEIIIEGRVNALMYIDKSTKKNGLLRKK